MAKRAGFRFMSALVCVALTNPAQAAPRRRPAPVAPVPTPAPAPAPSTPPAATATPAGGVTITSQPAASTSEYNWRQVVVAPRLAGDLRAFAIDPVDPNNIYIGTRGGTIIRSNDGGVTWDETELSPLLYRQRLIEPMDTAVNGGVAYGIGGNVIQKSNQADARVNESAPGAARKTRQPIGSVQTTDLVRRSAQDRLDIEWKGLPNFEFSPIHYAVYQSNPLATPLLSATAGRPPQPRQRVNRIVVCPSAQYTLLVATPTAVLGSSDGGNTFVQLHFGTERDPILNVACSPANPDEVIVTTASGPLISTDGGNSFNILEGPLAQGGASAVVYGQAEGNRVEAFMATGREIWMGDLEAPPDSPNAPRVSTPGDDRPVVEVEWITTTAGAIWLATGNGARVSRDHGKTWDSLGPELLEGYRWTQIAARAGTQANKEDVAVLNEELSMVSHDGGEFWEPFFPTATRRPLRQVIATSAGFWLLTSAELWTTAPRPPNNTDLAVPAVTAHAKRRLAHMAGFDSVLNGVLDKAGLSAAELEDLVHRVHTRAWLPRLEVATNFGRILTLSDRTVSVTDPSVKNTLESKPVFAIQGILTWDLPDLTNPPANYGISNAQKDLHAMRQELTEIVEDAYNERLHLLQELASGTMDLEQQLITNARIEWLDALLGELGERAQ